jgi:hypothetical protein
MGPLRGNEKGATFDALHHEDISMANTEKAEVKKETPRPSPPAPPKTAPLGLGAGLESPRSPYC